MNTQFTPQACGNASKKAIRALRYWQMTKNPSKKDELILVKDQNKLNCNRVREDNMHSDLFL